MIEHAEYQHLLIFGWCVVVAWVAVIRLLPRLLLRVYKRALLGKGVGEGPAPINTMYTEPQELFANPIHPPAQGSNLMTTGVNRDTLAVVGWLDLRKGPQVLRVPDMASHYYSVQFTDPSRNVNFAYVGMRATGTEAGAYLISGPRRKGAVPAGMGHIAAPKNEVFLLARVLVENEGDLPTARGLAKQIELSPL